MKIEVIEYMNDINKKISQYKQKCNLNFNNVDGRYDILLTKR